MRAQSWCFLDNVLQGNLPWQKSWGKAEGKRSYQGRVTLGGVLQARTSRHTLPCCKYKASRQFRNKIFILKWRWENHGSSLYPRNKLKVKKIEVKSYLYLNYQLRWGKETLFTLKGTKEIKWNKKHCTIIGFTWRFVELKLTKLICARYSFVYSIKSFQHYISCLLMATALHLYQSNPISGWKPFT